MARRTDDRLLWLAGAGGVLVAGYYLWPWLQDQGIGGALTAAVTGKRRTTTKAELARLAALEPDVRAKLEQLAARLLARGIHLYWGEAVRTEAEQKARLAKGKSTTINSWHRAGRAIDAYPIDEKTQKPDTKARNEKPFRIMHQEWHKLGGTGLAYKPYPDGPRREIQGARGPFWDVGHLEHHGEYSNAVAAIQARDRKAVA